MSDKLIPPPTPPSGLETQPPAQTGSMFGTKVIQDIIVGVIVVLFIGFAAAFIAVGGMIVNYEAEHQASYEALKEQVANTNAKIDIITNGLQQKHILP